MSPWEKKFDDLLPKYTGTLCQWENDLYLSLNYLKIINDNIILNIYLSNVVIKGEQCEFKLDPRKFRNDQIKNALRRSSFSRLSLRILNVQKLAWDQI